MKQKAIALMSGGLDSNLAVKLIHEMGIDLMGVHFTGPFCQCNRGKGGCISYAKEMADSLGIPFKTIALGEKYLDIVKNPRYGYGSGINPCMDCRILMFSCIREIMQQEEALFVVTGEVVGQRPMSQMFNKLLAIEHESGLEGLILRPLCAGHMPLTLPEKEGWVDRKKLLSIQGRQRRKQIELADFLKIGDYPCPAGGCLLTDKNFANKMRDQIKHDGLKLGDIPFLKIGRHFRLQDGSKLIVGRNQEENNRLEKLAKKTMQPETILLIPLTIMGPSALLFYKKNDNGIVDTAASIVADYCDGVDSVEMICKKGNNITNLKCERLNKVESSKIKI